MIGEVALDRTVWRVTGNDKISFLQGLVSNDLLPLQKGPGIVWAALLSPQGKYLADFFIVRPDDQDQLLIDIATPLAASTLRRLSMYRLRAAVQIDPSPLSVLRGLQDAPAGSLADPRHSALGWRAWTEGTGGAPQIDWDAIRVDHCIPESGIELVPDDTYLLEAGFERLHGVDFRKGCYVGQEVTARMKHKTELRKGLGVLSIEGSAPVGTAILRDGKEVGTLFTQSHGKAIAQLRFDRVADGMTAGDARLSPLA